jgi:hypothetical protein
MTVDKWLLTGFPLMAVGAFGLYSGMTLESGARGIVLWNSFAVIYILVGFLAALNKPWCREITRIAWYPMFLGIPIGTFLAVMALRVLRDDTVERAKFLEAVRTLSPEEAAKIVRREAVKKFVIKEEHFTRALVDDLRIAPFEVTEFIEDLESDYGFSFTRDFSIDSVSVEQLIAAIISNAVE